MRHAGGARRTDEFYRAAVAESPTAIVAVDEKGRIGFVNQRARQLLGGRDVVACRFDELFTPADRRRAAGYVAGLAHSEMATSKFFTGDVASTDRDGVRFVHVHGRRLRIAGQPDDVLLLVLIDSTEAREREQELERHALYDSLTGLANRTLLLERLRAVCDRGSGGVLLLLDLDNFKSVNDRWGHSAGDTILVEVAQRLRRALPSSATVARLGGDEFAVVLPEVTAEVAAKMAASLCEDIAQPFPGMDEPVTSSIGFTDVVDADTTMRRADIAMYAAKATGRNGALGYSPEVERSLREVPASTDSVAVLRAERDRLHAEARTDALTGLPNRRALDEYVAASAGQPASLLFIDLDRFSAYNHRHGDHEGDRALRDVAASLAGSCRESDLVFRKGGEEFVVVLPATDVTDARATGERIRATVQGQAIEHGGLPDVPVLTVTIGVADRADGDLAEAMRIAGDLAYASKVAGLRNRVVTAS